MHSQFCEKDSFGFSTLKSFWFCTIFFFFYFLVISFSVRKGNGEDEAIEIPDVFFNTNRLRQRHFYDEILLTLTRQPLQQVDSAVTQGVSFFFFFDNLSFFERFFFVQSFQQLSKFLFKGSNPFGLDLASINVLRGRDHGIRPYNDYVEVTGHRKVTSFDEFGPGVSLFISVFFFVNFQKSNPYLYLFVSSKGW